MIYLLTSRRWRCWTPTRVRDEEDFEARRQQRARVLFQLCATCSCGNRIHWIGAVVLGPPGSTGNECLVGHPDEIRAAEPRKQKHDRRDADLHLSPLVERRFPAIWLPTKVLLDQRACLRVLMAGRTRVCIHSREICVQNVGSAVSLLGGFASRLHSNSPMVDSLLLSNIHRSGASAPAAPTLAA